MEENTSFQDEESKQLYRRIVESMAWRQLASINILGHCLKFVADLDTKLRVASELDLYLRLFREVRALYALMDGADLESAVREHMDAIPLPDSRLEFGVSYFLTGLAEQVAMESYLESSSPEFAALARSYRAAATRRPEPTRFLEFCEDETNRPQAQMFLNRWVDVARRSFGKPGTPLGARAVELGIRTSSSAEMDEEFRRRLEPFLERCGLLWPELLGIQQDQQDSS